jgi:hypothetical protein
MQIRNLEKEGCQYFVPNANDYIQKGILVKVDNITLRK